MKIYARILILIGVLLSCCSPEEQTVQPGKVQFSVSMKDQSSGGGRTSAELLPESVVFLSLTKPSGESVFVRTPIHILTFGDSYISAPVELAPGPYIVTEFAIGRLNFGFDYVAPMEGSRLANAIADPLPRAITVSSTGLSTFAMEVLSTRHQQPQAFGYASFQPDLINPIPLIIFSSNNGSAITGADVRIYNEDEEYKFPDVNHRTTIPFRGRADEEYTLEVKQVGHETFQRTFVYNSLLTELNGHALSVILLEASQLWLELTPWQGVEYFMRMNMRGEGKVYVDWGDNTAVDTLRFPEDLVSEEFGANLRHTFDTQNELRAVIITGDIDRIFSFTVPNKGTYRDGQTYISSIDMSKASGLEVFEVAVSYTGPIKFSNSQQALHTLNFYEATVYDIVLPQPHRISTVRCSYSRLDYEELMNNLLQNSILYSVHGEFICYDHAYDQAAEIEEYGSRLSEEAEWYVEISGPCRDIFCP